MQLFPFKGTMVILRVGSISQDGFLIEVLNGRVFYLFEFDASNYGEIPNNLEGIDNKDHKLDGYNTCYEAGIL